MLYRVPPDNEVEPDSLSASVTVLLVAVGILELLSLIVMIDAWLRSRRQPDLAERFRPDEPGSLAEDAQDWLDNRT